MTRPKANDVRPGAYVWIASTWPWPVVFHGHRAHDDPDVEIERRVNGIHRTGVLPAWAFTHCGLLTSTPMWEPGWSDQRQPTRFAVGPSRGEHLPLRLLNPAETRPCRRCFDTASD